MGNEIFRRSERIGPCGHENLLRDATCSAGPESTFQDELLDKLVGRWRLTGTMIGHELLQECSAEWVLNHQFVRLSCHETRKPPLFKVPYEAVTYIGCSGETQRYVNYLLDVFGAAETPGFGRRTDNQIEFVWDDPNGAFHATMTWNLESDSWTFLSQQKDRSGKWGPFAEKTLRRVSPAK